METRTGENHKFLFFLCFNSLHRFLGFDLLGAPSPKICKLLLVVGYNLIEAPTSDDVGNNLIEAPNFNNVGVGSSKKLKGGESILCYVDH